MRRNFGYLNLNMPKDPLNEVRLRVNRLAFFPSKGILDQIVAQVATDYGVNDLTLRERVSAIL